MELRQAIETNAIVKLYADIANIVVEENEDGSYTIKFQKEGMPPYKYKEASTIEEAEHILEDYISKDEMKQWEPVEAE